MENFGPREVYEKTPGCVTVAVTAWPPLVQINRKPFYGPIVSIFRLLMERMQQCYYMAPTPDQQWGDKLNGTWTGMVAMIQRNDAEVAMGPMAFSWSRTEVIKYAVAYMNSDQNFLYEAVTKIPPNMYIFATPYVGLVWACFLISIVLVGLAGALIHRGYDLTHGYTDDEVDPERRRAKNKGSPYNMIMWSAQIFLGQDEYYQPKGDAARVLIFMWGAMTLILSTTYKCNLKALIITSKVVPPFDSTDELVAQTEYKWTLVEGTYYGGFFKEMYLTAPTTVAGQMWPLKANALPDVDAVLPAVFASKVAVVAPRFFQRGFMSMDFEATGQCRLAMTKHGFHDLYLTFTYAKNFTLQKELNTMLLRVIEAGLPDEIMNFELRKSANCQVKHVKSSDDSRPFNIIDFYGLLCVYMFGNIIAIFALFGEICFHRMKKKKEDDKVNKRIRALDDVLNVGRDAVIGSGSLRTLHGH